MSFLLTFRFTVTCFTAVVIYDVAILAFGALLDGTLRLGSFLIGFDDSKRWDFMVLCVLVQAKGVLAIPNTICTRAAKEQNRRVIIMVTPDIIYNIRIITRTIIHRDQL